MTTHSAHIIDIPSSTVFALESSRSGTSVRRTKTSGDRWRLVRSLGYLASDLAQARSVIWVEGAADAVYIREWLRMMSPDLQDGIHFTLVLYGGVGNLMHHSADTDGSVQMLAVNRHTAFIVDSDCEGPDDNLSQSVADTVEKLSDAGVHVWVTEGRQIESYVRLDVESDGQLLDWVPLEPFEAFRKRKKVVRAEAAVDEGLTFVNTLDLKERIKQLSDFIRNDP